MLSIICKADGRANFAICPMAVELSLTFICYLPGDVIGLDAALRIRPLEEVMALTSLTIETINTATALSELMACRPTALYIAWLLGQRQRAG
jgi:hypothetical protein